MIRYIVLVLLLGSFSFLSACDGGSSNSSAATSNSGGSGAGSADDAATTDFAVSVALPEGSAVVDNSIDLNPFNWLISKAIAVDEAQTGLDLSNFQVRLYSQDGTSFETVEIAEFVDNGDGTYFISVPGDPRVDCILVSVLQVNGESVELQIPATNAGSQAAPLEISYASTAATQKYIEQIVESGGFDENLSVEEVTSLVEAVVKQVASIILPADVNPTDPNAVIAALAANAADIVEAQLEIALAPEPEAGSLLAFQGNYHGGLLARFVFGSDVVEGGNLDAEVTYEDFTFAPADTASGKEASLAGIPVIVDEDTQMATVTLGSRIETIFGTIFKVGQESEQYTEQEAVADDSEQLVAAILPSGKMIINPGSGLVSEGFTFNDGQDDYYFAEINNSSNLNLIPWGEAYVSSGFFKYTEYRLNDCFGSLGITNADLSDIQQQEDPSEAFEEFVIGLNDSLSNAGAIMADECEPSGTSHEVIAITMAKESESVSNADLAGDWGVVGLLIGNGSTRGVFSSVLTLDEAGGLSESNFIGVDGEIDFDSGSVGLGADVFSIEDASYSVESDGILEINWEPGEIDSGYVSADQGLLHVSGAIIDQGDNEGYAMFGVPLGANVTPADLDGKTFEAVGLSMSVETSGLPGGSGDISSNQDSNAGFTLTFALNGDNLEVTLGGSTDLGTVGITLSSSLVSEWTVGLRINDPVAGTLPVALSSNGEITIEVAGESAGDEDLLLRGFYGANGRLIVSIFGADMGAFDVIDAAAQDQNKEAYQSGFSFANFGYLLAICSAGCDG
jgi:hypothetical protein